MTQSARLTREPATRRRTYKILGLALLLLTLALALPTTASAFISTGDGAWVWQNPLPQGNDLSAVTFVDATHGWAVGGNGVILATADGGATWSAQSSGSDAGLSDVAFPDATHGWAVGGNGVILATADGGATWSAQSSGSDAGLSDVAFPDATHGWAVGWQDPGGWVWPRGNGVILATTTGGAT